MNRTFKTIMLGAILAVSLGAVAFADGAADPVVGTWALNSAKSKFTPGPALKSQTRTYTQTADGMKMTYTGVTASGATMAGESTFKLDGKDYPITGTPDYDMLSLQRVNANTVKSMQKKGGKVIGSTVRSLSAKGKMLTLDSKGTDAMGVKFHNVQVYDRQ